MELAGSVSQPVETMVTELITRHIEQLSSNDLEYLVDGVWGYSAQGKLDELQMEVHEAVMAVVGEALGRLAIPDLNAAQEFTLNYLIRSLVIAKLGHAVEMYRTSLYREALYKVAWEDRYRHLKGL
jgi:hypothetical protein